MEALCSSETLLRTWRYNPEDEHEQGQDISDVF
jgi:hypothetical protein